MDKILNKKKNFLLSNSSVILLSAILSGISIWWSPDFFTKNTFYNPGDILFPYNIYNGLLDRIDAWNYAAYSSFGKNESYNSLTYSIYYLFLGILEYFGIQNWVLNRIYNFLPTFLLGASISNLILKTVELKGINRISVIVCAIFFVSSLPLTTLDPMLSLGWASVIYLITLLYLSINKKINYLQIVLGGVCLSILTVAPRLVILLIIFFILNSIFYYKSIVNIIRSTLVIGLLALPFFLIAVFPAILTSIQQLPFEFISNDISVSRKETVNFYYDSTRLSRSILLMYLQDYNYYNSLFKQGTVIIASTILLIPLIYIIFKSINKNCKNEFLINNFLFFLILSASFGSSIYLLIMNFIPGFWIINNPQYILSVLAIFYSVIMCAGLNSIIEDFKLKQRAIITILLILLISIFSVNRVMLLNTIDGKKIELGQHHRYFKIPDYVDRIILSTSCQYEKALILPSSSNGYYTYKAWPISGMPNIFTSYYCFNTFGLSREELKSLRQIAPETTAKLENLNIKNLRDLGIRYVINDKSVLEFNSNDKKFIYNSIYNELTNDKSLLKYSDDNIDLYDLKIVKPYISVTKDNKLTKEIKGSALLTTFLIPIDQYGEYSINTLMLKNSTWDVYLSSDPNGKLSIYDEFVMLLKDPHNKNINNEFIGWDVETKNYKNIIIYNKSSISNYYKIIFILCILYYSFIILIYILFFKNVQK